ncbi:MAG: cupin domain-containing protein [Candidatus Eisenbacteria bacterium]
MTTVEQLKSLLKLKPLEPEGGHFAETYRSDLKIPLDALPGPYQAARALATAIYYLLTPDTFSALHRLPADEIYHFYLGDPVEMLLLREDGSDDTRILGQNILANMELQVIVPKRVWQGSRLLPGGRFALLGTTMSPGYDPGDYEPGGRDELIKAFPNLCAEIRALTI